MGVLIESSVWEPVPSIHIFIFLSCFFSLSLFPYYLSKHAPVKSPSPFDHATFSPRFQRNFLFIYSLAAVMEGLWSVYGEYELAYYGVSKQETVSYLCIGFGASLLLGSFLGVFSDLMGQEKFCLLFCILHLFVGILKRITAGPSIWIANICLSLATSIFSFSFETWVVVEHKRLGHRQDALNDTFWLMTFFESASLIGSQVLANWMLGSNLEKGIAGPSSAVIFLAIMGIIFVSGSWKGTSETPPFKDYRVSFYSYILDDKRIWLLVFAQGCLQFSVVIFWILWAPTLVADGREVHLGLVYPCLMGARMLGSTVFPWLISASLRTEDCLACAFLILGLVMSIIAYDYQEIGILVTLFSLFHACVGLILPLLARLRTMYVPNELRGGMISLSLAPADAAALLFLMQRGYNQNIENSTMIAFAALGLCIAAGCMNALKRWGKQPYQNWHKS
ncbi:hypothetical protein SLE2022_301080 [Rubroshorea leprosula]